MMMQFDIRVKFIVLILASIITSTINNNLLFIGTIVLLGLYLLIQRLGNTALKSIILMGIINIMLSQSSNWPNGLNVIIVMMAFILKLIPLAMASKPLFMANPSEIIASFEKMHLPRGLFMTITFMLRFYPTVKFELAKIRNALKLRGILSIKKPLLSLEYLIVPLMIRSSKISDQLAAAAEVRGISNPNRHTSIRMLEVKRCDYVLCILAIIYTVSVILADRGVIL
ncbi:energy-coupling factor transporter transmembrane component T [Clostridiaceae bacterium M8S5]|nr:energy-coupling factor transporter transmembrane component T [Clostridiaceae bacterium M8S5]